MTPVSPDKDEVESLRDKLCRFVAMPEWPRFYMDKAQAEQCIAAMSPVDRLREALEDALAFIRGDIAGPSQREAILREGDAALSSPEPGRP